MEETKAPGENSRNFDSFLAERSPNVQQSLSSPCLRERECLLSSVNMCLYFGLPVMEQAFSHLLSLASDLFFSFSDFFARIHKHILVLVLHSIPEKPWVESTFLMGPR